MRNILALIAGAMLAILCSQLPEYSQQYAQRLGGALDELNSVIADFDATAQRAGLTRDQALATYESANDEFLVERGQDMRATLVRQVRLTNYFSDLQQGNMFTHTLGLFRYFDGDIGRRALENYKPGVPITFDGIIYALIGFVLGYIFLRILSALVARPFARRARAAPNATGSGPRQ